MWNETMHPCHEGGKDSFLAVGDRKNVHKPINGNRLARQAFVTQTCVAIVNIRCTIIIFYIVRHFSNKNLQLVQEIHVVV